MRYLVSPAVPLHLLVLALVLAQQRQVVELLGHVRVVRAQHLLPDLQRPLAQRLGVLVLAPLAVQHGQVVQGGGHGGVVLREGGRRIRFL